MSTYSIEVHPRFPAFVTAFSKDFSFEHDLTSYRVEVARLLDSLAEQVFYVMDLRNLHFDFGEMAAATNLAARIDTANFQHPSVWQVIFVTKDSVWADIAAGMNSDVYGYLTIPVFESVEDALTYIRSQLR